MAKNYKLDAIDLNIKVNKLYKKLRNKKSFNKDKFKLLLLKLANKYKAKRQTPIEFCVTLEQIGYKKPVRGLAVVFGDDVKYIHSVYGKIGTLEEDNIKVVHKGFLNCNDLEYNYNIVNSKLENILDK